MILVFNPLSILGIGVACEDKGSAECAKNLPDLYSAPNSSIAKPRHQWKYFLVVEFLRTLGLSKRIGMMILLNPAKSDSRSGQDFGQLI